MRKINCTISFQYILLYILALFPFSSILLRGCELYCFHLVTHIREEIKKDSTKRKQERTCELQLSKKKRKKSSLAGLICEA